jgi:hypothetical protein
VTIEGENDSQQGASGSVLESTMSLVGRLEDLSLGEILQIVSLSKRSGLLWLESPQDKAKIYIRTGKVIYAARSDESEGVISLLVHHGLVKLEQIDAIREELEESKNAEQLRGILDEKLGITPEAFQQVLKKRVEEIVYSLFHWEEGTFSFQLIENEADHPLLNNMSAFFLDDGIGAQFLVMEGARRKDELRRESPGEPAAEGTEPAQESAGAPEEWEEEFEQQLAGEPAVSEETSGLIKELEQFEIPHELPPLPGHVIKTAVLIGLNRTLAAEIAQKAPGKGITLLVHEDGADGLTRIQELRQNRLNPFLVLDIEAAGITDDREVGGLEILSTLWDLGSSLHVGLVCSRELPEGLLAKLSSIPGIYFFSMPNIAGEEEAAEQILDTFEKILSDSADSRYAVPREKTVAVEDEPVGFKPDVTPDGESVPSLVETAQPEADEDSQGDYYDIQQELSDDLDGIDLPFEELEGEEPPREKSLDPHMDQLSSYVSELNRQDISGEITLLALRFASFFVSRAVLFLVRKDDIKGLGQFGVDLGEGKDADSAVRTLTLDLGEKGPMGAVVLNQRSYKGPPTGSETEKTLFEALGGGIPREMYVGPIVSMGKVAVLLYGDDHPANTGIEPTHTLDIFLSHVGLALDRAFLEMKLKTQR